jgi:polysaccharide export outer membrane protein
VIVRGSRPILGALFAVLSLHLAAGCASTTNAEVNRAIELRFKRPERLNVVLPMRPGGDPEYRIGNRDVIGVRIIPADPAQLPLTIELEVGPDGALAVPYAGRIQAAGRTIAGLHDAIAVALRGRVFVDPQVVVTIASYRSRRIVVGGEVTAPGQFFLDRSTIPVSAAIAEAKGLTARAGAIAYVVRTAPDGAATRIPVDLVRLLYDGDPRADVEVLPDDLVDVPEGEEFYVTGWARSPGAFKYNRPITLMQALGLAGGLHPYDASPSAVVLSRPGPKGLEKFEVDVAEIARGAAPDLPIRPGDTINCGRTVPWAIYLEVKQFLNPFGVAAAITAAK